MSWTSSAAGLGADRRAVGCPLDADGLSGGCDHLLRRRCRGSGISTEQDRQSRSNLVPARAVVIVGRPGGEPPFAVLATCSADPAEGEALTGAGNGMVETVPMPLLDPESLGYESSETPMSNRKTTGATRPHRLSLARGDEAGGRE